MTKNLIELTRAFEEFKQMPFPEDSDHEEVSQFHAELAEYDGFIAGLVSILLAGDRVSPELLRVDDDLKASLENIARTGQQPAASDAAKYLCYLGALKKVIDLAYVQAYSFAPQRG